MGTLPFLTFGYKGHEIPEYSKDICKETAGDCFEFVKKYLKVDWIQSDHHTAESNSLTTYESRKCNLQDIG